MSIEKVITKIKELKSNLSDQRERLYFEKDIKLARQVIIELQEIVERIEVNLRGIEQAHEIYSCVHGDYVKGAIKSIREILVEHSEKN